MKRMAGEYRDQKRAWAATMVFTKDGIPDDERHYWRGYVDALNVILDWPTQVQRIVEREAATRE